MSEAFVEHSTSDTAAWAAAHFGGAALGHVQRSERLTTLAEAFARQPGKSIPRLFSRTYDIKAAYTFLEHPSSTPDALQASHRRLVLAEAARPGVVLFLEDTSDVSYTHRRERVAGLGSIGSGEAWEQGFWLHTTLAVACPDGRVVDEDGRRAPVRVLGIADQQVGTRPWPPKRPTPNKQSRGRRGQGRETERWPRTSERIGPAPDGARWVRVADRGADIYEYLVSCGQVGHGHTVRASHNRVLVDIVDDARKVFDRVRRVEAAGEFRLELRTRPKREAREAVLSVAWTTAVLRAPQRPGGAPGTRPPVACSVVRVWEANPPEGEEPLEWILLCDGVIATLEQARERVAEYATRWLIEEFHKALKTGLGAERLQLDEAPAIFAAVAVMSVVALRLVELREHVRQHAEAPADHSGLSTLELEVLRVRLKREIRTVRDVALAIGRLGGHMNRAGDGMPGWITLWRGMQELTSLVEGVRLSKFLSGAG